MQHRRSPPGPHSWRIGVDIGGTFTDGLAWNESTGEMARVKVLSTPNDPGRAFMTAVQRLFRDAGAGGERISYLVHGTTVATNAVLEHRLASTAFVTTRGFRDLLEIARQVRPDPYDVFARKPRPLVPRDCCFEVEERIAADGSVVVPLDERSLDVLVAELEHASVDAIAVCLLHAYRNPAHERAIAARLRRAFPRCAISISSDLSAEFREFPRACTAIINAGLIPAASRYLSGLDSELASIGVRGNRLVMQSNGGTADFQQSAVRPVFMIESGPAAGLVGAAHIARLFGHDRIVSFDMGGTTAKAGLVQDATPHTVQEFEIGVEENRSRNWFGGASGYPILTPAVDLVEIGTGGGSIAYADSGGRLRVGPRSAGANPGPACYGMQDEQPTITDANLVLGRLNPDYFLGGEMRLDVAAARRAIGRLAERIGMDVVAAASGIVQIADAAMSQALRVVSVQRGYDPREFRLVAFGGAGPLHAVSLAAETGIPSVVVPPRPGLASAFGLLVADVKHDLSRTLVQRLERADPRRLQAVFDELEAQGAEILRVEGVEPGAAAFDRSLDIRYVGQSYQLAIRLDGGRLTQDALADAQRRFNEVHRSTYGYAEPSEPGEIVNVRISAYGRIAKPTLADAAGAVAGSSAEAGRGVRPVYFEGNGFVECSVYDRLRLGEGAVLDGPAIAEEPDSTTLVHPGWRAHVQRFGVLVIDRLPGGQG